MPCYNPIHGYRAKRLNDSGKRGIVFSKTAGLVDQPVTVPCGQCIGCRLERSRRWAVRCMHEAQMHEDNSFVTLTYSEDHLPYRQQLTLRHHQEFMKRLRHHLPMYWSDEKDKWERKKIKFFHCGEYGDDFGRPHYHTLLFGFRPTDLKKWKENKDGDMLYRSDMLDSVWKKGMTVIGEVTFKSAAYVARYCTKKVTGDKADEHYEAVDLETGEIFQREPEYATMSRAEGIGKTWMEKYKADIYPSDSVIVNGHPQLPPPFYDTQLTEDEQLWIKARRKKKAALHAIDSTTARLYTRQDVKEAQFRQLKRGLEQ
jgi:hypothetical protein